jgi:hypothetical protein
VCFDLCRPKGEALDRDLPTADNMPGHDTASSAQYGGIQPLEEGEVVGAVAHDEGNAEIEAAEQARPGTGRPYGIMDTEYAAAYGQLDDYTEREDGTTIGIGGMTNVSRVGSCWWASGGFLRFPCPSPGGTKMQPKCNIYLEHTDSN